MLWLSAMGFCQHLQSLVYVMWMIADLDVISCILEPNVRMRGTPVDPSDPSLLFDDTSAGGNKHEHSGVGKGPDVYPGQALLSDPMSNLAMAYGSSLASHGKEMMDKNVRQAVWVGTVMCVDVCECVVV